MTASNGRGRLSLVNGSVHCQTQVLFCGQLGTLVIYNRSPRPFSLTLITYKHCSTLGVRPRTKFVFSALSLMPIYKWRDSSQKEQLKAELGMAGPSPLTSLRAQHSPGLSCLSYLAILILPRPRPLAIGQGRPGSSGILKSFLGTINTNTNRQQQRLGQEAGVDKGGDKGAQAFWHKIKAQVLALSFYSPRKMPSL